MRLALAGLVGVVCMSLWTRPAFAEGDDNTEESGVFGQASLLGPRALGTFEVGYQVLRHLQVGVAVGVNHASATKSDSSGVSSSASATLVSPYLFARGFIWKRHSPIFEAGLGLSHILLSAEGHDAFGNQLGYDRGGDPLMALAGAGYGFRADNGFQVNVVMGYLGYFTGLAKSKVSTAGAISQVSQQDLDSFRSQEDDISDGLVQSGLYLRAGIGFMF